MITYEIRIMKYDLEPRLIQFSVMILKLAQQLPADRTATHLAGQLMHSGTAPALLYGEAQSAESRKDFIHKMRIGLKELRETFVCLRLIEQAGVLPRGMQTEKLMNENNELIAIFHKSVLTAAKNLREETT